MTSPQSWDVIVLGGGAAGLFCAAVAGARGRRVLVLERNDAHRQEGARSPAAGAPTSPTAASTADNFVSHNPDFARSALARFTPDDFLALVERAPHPLGRAQARPALLPRLGQGHHRDAAGRVPERARRDPHAVSASAASERVESDRAGPDGAARFAVQTEGRRAAVPRRSSWPRVASPTPGSAPRDLGYRLARQRGLAVVPPRPGLVPLEWSRAERPAGTTWPASPSPRPSSAAARASRRRCSSRTEASRARRSCRSATTGGWAGTRAHRPAAGGRPRRRARSAHEPRATARRRWAALAERLPRRWPSALVPAPGSPCDRSPVRRARPRRAGRSGRSASALQPAEDAGYDKAEVTLGGVDTGELSSRTLESRRVPGPLLHRRGGGHDRLARRLQLPVGLGLGPRRGAGRLGAAPAAARSRVARAVML